MCHFKRQKLYTVGNYKYLRLNKGNTDFHSGKGSLYIRRVNLGNHSWFWNRKGVEEEAEKCAVLMQAPHTTGEEDMPELVSNLWEPPEKGRGHGMTQDVFCSFA